MRQSFSIAEPPSRELDEDVFERRRGYFEAGEFIALSFQMLHQRNDGLRRTLGVEHVAAVYHAAIRDPIKTPERGIGFGRLRSVTVEETEQPQGRSGRFTRIS